VDQEVQRFSNSVRNLQAALLLSDYWDDQSTVFRPPMTSLRDVDEAGTIVASAFDALAQDRRTVNLDEVATVMRAIRSQRGVAAETDSDVPERAP
jgi:hypothetical protein